MIPSCQNFFIWKGGKINMAIQTRLEHQLDMVAHTFNLALILQGHPSLQSNFQDNPEEGQHQ